MKTVWRTKISRESLKLRIIRPLVPPPELYCEDCEACVPHSGIRQAALMLSVSELAVFRMAENGQVHATETPDGALLVCSNSVNSAAEFPGIESRKSSSRI